MKKLRHAPREPEHSTVFTRRNALLAGMSFAAVAAVYGLLRKGSSEKSDAESVDVKLRSYLTDEQRTVLATIDTDVARYLLNFPAQELAARPSVHAIRVHSFTEKDKKLLIHVLQKHDTFNGTNGRATESVIRVQRNIHDIFTFMAEHKNIALRQIFSEGHFPEHERQVSENQRLVRAGKAQPPSPFVLEANAAMRLATERNIELRGTEDRAIHAKNAALVEKELRQGRLSDEDMKFGHGLFDQREDVALDIVSREKGSAHVIVYGAAHEFGDNVQRWNDAHPDNRFGLVEIAPAGVFDAK